MKLDTFFDKFDQLADAPGGVAKMRELVLELAVRGKLSEHRVGDSEDTVWLTLTQQLDAETISNTAQFKPPFEIPNWWRWTTLKRLGDTKPRNDAPDDTKSSFVPMTLIPAAYGQMACHEERLWGEIKKGYTHFKNMDVVMAKITPCFENGKSAVMYGLTGGFGAGTTELHVFRRTSDAVLPEFVVIYLKTTGFISRGIPAMTGSAGQKRVPSDYFASSPFPLPPLAEQKRIVAKVDELMALCDRLEAQQKERETRHSTLARASLARFADEPTPANLQFLFHKSYDIKPADLRKSILTLAVRGKLVLQDPNDEPATKLLERIQKLKERLIRERAIRRQETDSIDCGSAPFPIPQSWVWTRLGEIGDWGSGSTPPRGNHDLYDGGITWLKSGELNDNLALAGSAETVTELALKTGSFRRNQPGDVLFAMYGATIGKVAILAEPAVTNQAVCGCTPFEGVSNRYLFNYLVSQRAAFHEASEGGAQPNLSKVKVVAFPFPLPPLAEQKRIVAKVEQLMALVDELEAQLAASRGAGEQLLAGIVAELQDRKTLTI
jgi:type I restriction enzyme, S subunit